MTLETFSLIDYLTTNFCTPLHYTGTWTPCIKSSLRKESISTGHSKIRIPFTVRLVLCTYSSMIDVTSNEKLKELSIWRFRSSIYFETLDLYNRPKDGYPLIFTEEYFLPKVSSFSVFPSFTQSQLINSLNFYIGNIYHHLSTKFLCKIYYCRNTKPTVNELCL